MFLGAISIWSKQWGFGVDGGKCHQSSSGWFCCAATTSCRGILIIIIIMMMLTIIFLCLVSLQHPAQTDPKACYKWSCCCHPSCTGWAITNAVQLRARLELPLH